MNTAMAPMNTDKADDYIDRIKDLPPAPTVATELLDLFRDSNSDIDRVVELIRFDPSLTAKILKRCNNTYFGNDEPSTDIFEVVTRLGFYEVYCIVAALVGASVMALGKSNHGLDIDTLWRHSVASAVAASNLARRAEESEAVAFTAGLLHEIGKLVLSSVEGAPYAKMVQENAASGTSLAAAEIAAFGVDHATIGAQLLVRWGLPNNIAVAVLFHNGASESGKPFARLIAIVQIASVLANQLGAKQPQVNGWSSRHAEAMNLLGLTEEEIPEMIAEMETEQKRFDGLCKLNFDPVI
jgi:putative nucleotidyltransferase with HDIG domain